MQAAGDEDVSLNTVHQLMLDGPQLQIVFDPPVSYPVGRPKGRQVRLPR